MKSKGELTKEKILVEATRLVNQRGFEATSINDLVAATGLKKGCLYFHFSGKDELALAILEKAKSDFDEFLNFALAGTTPGECIDRFFQGVYGAPPWPKVDVMRKVLEGEKVVPGEVAYVGDSKEDLAVAQATGVYFIGRVNKEPFGGLEVPVYPDMAGVKEHLKKMIV